MSPFIIAELSANHGGSLEIALESVKAVAQSGCDSIKLQTYTQECLTLPFHSEYFRIKGGLWSGKYLWDLYKEAQMPWEWHSEIFKLAKSLNLVAFSSPFSVRGVEFLEKLDCPIYKIASFEVAHIPMLEAIAESRKEVIISLGVATDAEIESALNILKNNAKITLLYCISAYPAKLESIYLANMAEIKKRWEGYHVKVGISDHTKGIVVPIAATLCGASTIEKHFILHKDIDSPDREFSLDSKELCEMVKGVREASRLDLQTIKIEETKSGREFARSLFVSKDSKKGEIISLDNISCVRPNDGLSPLRLKEILGKRFSKDVRGGDPLREGDFD